MSLVNEVSSKYLTGRIKRFGVQSLSDKELLYYLLNVKMQSKKASEACNAFFKDFSGLFQIKDFVPENWELLLGNDEQSLLMEAICEFSKRMKCQFKLPLGQFCSSSVVGKYMIDVLGDESKKHWSVFFLIPKIRFWSKRKFSRGL